MTDVEPLLSAGQVSVLITDGSADPTDLALQIAYATANGLDLTPFWPCRQSRPTTYVSALYGDLLVQARLARIAALPEYREYSKPEALRILTDPDQNLRLFEADRDSIRPNPMMIAFAETLARAGTRFLVLDFFVRYLNRAGLSWDIPDERTAALDIIGELARHIGASILIVPSPWPVAEPNQSGVTILRMQDMPKISEEGQSCRSF